ncbi:hypothetical protein [Actinopolymorpha pittospori]|uniref:Uncharacterized protein n=1 Tax=Actinopolymorpha pittospori TaxID=648752 RepID=A0A927MPP6_9ACTN|nr:hypothetical protein [Actinopolymorpha pittospori]MBE1603809.1 hypothetical protein [Actinopolymorpha pittospori]
MLAALVGHGPDGFDGSATDWVILNTVTVGMAAIGIALALGFAQPWGSLSPGAAGSRRRRCCSSPGWVRASWFR